MSILDETANLQSAEQALSISNKAEALNFAKDATFLEKLGAGIEDESLFVQLGNQAKNAVTNGMYQDSIYAMDSDFLGSPDKDKMIAQIARERGLRPEYLSNIKDQAMSPEHLGFLIDDRLEKQRNKDAVDDSVLGGFGYYMAGALADVVPLIATGNLAGSAGRLAFTTARFLTKTAPRRFASVGAYEAGLELGKEFYTSERDRTIIENVSAIVGGTVIGGLLQKQVGKELDIVNEGIESVLRNQQSVTPEALAKADELAQKGDFEGARNELFKGKLDMPDELSGLKPDEILNNLKLRAVNNNMTAKVYNSLRFDLGYYLQHSASPTMQRFANELVEDPLMLGAKNIEEATSAVIPAMKRKVDLEKDLKIAYDDPMLSIFKDYYNDVVNYAGRKKPNLGRTINGVIETVSRERNLLQNKAFEIQFDMGEYVRRGYKSEEEVLQFHAEDLSKHSGLTLEASREYVERLSKAMKEVAKNQYDALQKSGNKRFQGGEGSIPRDEYYVPHQYKRGILDSIRASGIKDNDLGDYLANSYRRANFNDLTPAQIAKLESKKIFINSKDFQNKMRNSMIYFIRKATGDIYTQETLDKVTRESDSFEDAIRKHFTDEEIDLVFKLPQGDNQAKFTKFRKKFDRGHIETINGREFKFRDLLETNTESLALKYSRQMAGYTALSQMRSFNKTFQAGGKEISLGLDSRDAVDGLFNKVRQEIMESKNLSDSKKNAEIERARHIFRHMLGEPTADNPASKAHQASSILNSLTIGTKLGMAGLAMVAELNNVIWRVGFAGLDKRSGYLSAVKDLIRDGKIKNEFAQEAYFNFHAGKELGDGFSDAKYDDALNPFAVQYSNDVYTPLERAMNKAQEIGEKLSSFTLMVSGVKPFTAMLQFGMSHALTQRFLKEPTEEFFQEIGREMNINKAMYERILNQFNKHADILEGDRVYKEVIIDGKKSKKLLGKAEYVDSIEQYANQTPEGFDTLIDRVIRETLSSEEDVALYNSFRNGEINLDDIIEKYRPEIADMYRGITGREITDEIMEKEIKGVIDGVNHVTDELDYLTRMAQKFPVLKTAVEDYYVRNEEIIKDVFGVFNSKEKAVRVFSEAHMDKNGIFDITEFLATIKHEMFHAPTLEAYKTIPKYKEFIDRIYTQARSDMPDIRAYGLTDPLELIAEGLSNKTFAKSLNNIMPNKKTSEVFNGFKASESSMYDELDISKDLGIEVNEGSLYDLIIRATKMTDSEKVIFVEKEGIPMGSTIKRPNFKDWDDDEAYRAFRSGITRVLDTYIQKGMATDEPGITIGGKLLQDTFYGRLALNLKNYMLTSYTKQLGRMLFNYNDRTKWIALSQAVSVMGMVTMQNLALYSGDKEKLEKSFEPERFTSNVIKKLSFSSFLPDLYDAGRVLATGSDSNNHSMSMFLRSQIAPLTVMDDLANVLSVPYKLAMGDLYGVGKGITRATPNILPVSMIENALGESEQRSWFDDGNSNKRKGSEIKRVNID